MIKKILFLGFLVFLFNSCDECSSVDCVNSTGCESGICICEKGFEGTTCKTKSNHKFLGAYDGTQNCNGSSTELELTHLTSGIEPYQVKLIFNGNSVDAETDALTLNIIEQTIKFNGDTVTILPTSGRLTGNSLVFSIHYQNTTVDKTCVYNFIRK